MNKPWKDRQGRDNSTNLPIAIKTESLNEEETTLVPDRKDRVSQPIDLNREDRVSQPINSGPENTVSQPIDAMERGRRERKFGNRARLYVGNLPRGMTEEDLRILFSPFGEIEQVFVEKDKNFGFVRMVRVHCMFM